MVRFDISQAGFRYFCVTFCTHFVTVWTVAIQCYKTIDQLVITPSVTTWVVFRKAVFGPSQNVVRFEKNQRKNLFLFTYKDNNSSKYYHSYQVQQNDVVSDSEIVTANQSYPDNRYPSQSYDKLVKG